MQQLQRDLCALKALMMSNHTTGCYARTPEGTSVYPDNPAASCFCLVGGMVKVADLEIDRSGKDLLTQSLSDRRFAAMACQLIAQGEIDGLIAHTSDLLIDQLGHLMLLNDCRPEVSIPHLIQRALDASMEAGAGR